jgi:hypothetical protein
MMRINELFILWNMLFNHHINIYYYLLDYLVSIVKKKPNDKGDIMVGGIITLLVRKFGVSVNQGIKRIEGNFCLDLHTITTLSLEPMALLTITNMNGELLELIV